MNYPFRLQACTLSQECLHFQCIDRSKRLHKKKWSVLKSNMPNIPFPLTLGKRGIPPKHINIVCGFGHISINVYWHLKVQTP